jgi:plastocyanin
MKRGHKTDHSRQGTPGSRRHPPLKVLRQRIRSPQGMLVLALSIAGVSLQSGCRGTLPGRVAPPPPGAVHARLAASGADSAAGPLLVYLEPLEARDAGVEPDPPTPAAIRPKDGSFSPALLVVTQGQQLRFRSDAKLVHRIFSYAEGNAFERELPAGAAAEALAFDHPGEVPYYCSLHPSERGTIFVAPSPWFARADSRSEIRIAHVPPGRYRVHVWGEGARADAREILVRPGEVAALDLEVRGGETRS